MKRVTNNDVGVVTTLQNRLAKYADAMVKLGSLKKKRSQLYTDASNEVYVHQGQKDRQGIYFLISNLLLFLERLLWTFIFATIGVGSQFFVNIWFMEKHDRIVTEWMSNSVILMTFVQKTFLCALTDFSFLPSSLIYFYEFVQVLWAYLFMWSKRFISVPVIIKFWIGKRKKKKVVCTLFLLY